jgi:seryl-tRNA synthetase
VRSTEIVAVNTL